MSNIRINVVTFDPEERSPGRTGVGGHWLPTQAIRTTFSFRPKRL
jgi:hypothetical protein